MGFLKKLSKKNASLTLVNLFMLSFLFFTYYFLVLVKESSYNPLEFKNFYLYFSLIQFILFSIGISFFETGSSKKNLINVSCFVLSIVPLYFIIFILGNISLLNFFPILFLEFVFGSFILSFKSFLKKKLPSDSSWLLGLTLVVILFLSLVFLYCLISYQEAVITTIYDKDINILFFLNPLLTAIGYVYSQITDYSQMGIKPFFLASVFWFLMSIVFIFLNEKNRGGVVAREK